MKKIPVALSLVFFIFLACPLAYAAEKVVVVPLLSKPTTLGSRILSASIEADGTIRRGDATTVSKGGTGTYLVTFPNDVDNCQWLGTAGGAPQGTTPNRTIGITQCWSTTDCLFVTITASDTAVSTDSDFAILAHCP